MEGKRKLNDSNGDGPNKLMQPPSSPSSRQPLKRMKSFEVPVHKNEKITLQPTNNFVSPMLTDLYQITMAYSYWKQKKQDDHSVFDLFFRSNPFKGEFTIFAGLEEVIRHVSNFHFEENEINYLKEVLPTCDPGFFAWLATLDCSQVKLYAIPEGTVVFPRIPLIRVEGPIAVCQLLETTLLTLVNYPSLIATNAVRHRLVAGPDKTLFEFGLRRAQGPDGGVSASRYSYLGGFDGTSNVLAAQLFGIPPKGTHAHSYVTSFTSEADLHLRTLTDSSGKVVDFYNIVKECHKELGFDTNEGELVSFSSYAISFPNGFLALVDTYDTLKSGIPNFLIVALALHKCGYKANGVRLDSGDLAYLSSEARKLFKEVSKKCNIDYFAKFTIVASNDINETTLVSLNQQGHEVDAFGIGTNLVTCQAQPALGCVYKLVEINNSPRIKISQEVSKVTLPGRKEVYRLYGNQHYPVIDLLVLPDEKDKPEVGKKILCLHPFDQKKRAYVTPSKVLPLHKLYWDQGKVCEELLSLEGLKAYAVNQVKEMRPDHIRMVNPTPYKISVSDELYTMLHNLWLKEVPIADLSA